jgi:hypothetical protein
MSIKNNIIAKVEIPNYKEYITLANSRRAKYYKRKDNIPKKYLDKSKYDFDNKGILFNLENKQKVISNPRSAGTPRLKKISGQDLWSGNINPHLRSKIAKELKDYFRSYFKVIKPLKSDDYPIGVKIDFYKSIGEGNWDIDNHAIFYRKTIMDSLKGVIEDDSVKYVRSIPCNYYDCLDKDKKIIVTIFKLNANV